MPNCRSLRIAPLSLGLAAAMIGWMPEISTAQVAPASPLPPISRISAGLPAPTPATTPNLKVALLDVTVAFRENKRFVSAMDEMKADIDEFADELALEEKKLQRRADALEGRTKNRKTEAEAKAIATAQAQRLVKTQLKKQAWVALEAQIYYEAYLDTQQHVKRLCEKLGVNLVLRYDRSAVNPNNHAAVLSAINRPIVYHNQLDITDLVVEALNQPNQQGYGLPPVTRGQIPMPPGWMMTIPAAAVQQVMTARTAWTVDRLVFPPAS